MMKARRTYEEPAFELTGLKPAEVVVTSNYDNEEAVTPELQEFGI